MRRLSTWILLLSFSMSTQAFAEQHSRELPVDYWNAVNQMLENEWGKGNVEWVVNSVPGIVSQSNAELLKVEAESHPRGTVLVQLTVGDDRGISRRIPLSLRVMPFAWVPVVRSGLKRGEVITDEAISWERREVTSVRGDWPETEAELQKHVMRMRRNLRAADILTWSDIEEVPDVLRGAAVTIIAQQGNVAITAPGKALQDGHTGDLIRVENVEYRRILEARVEGKGMVTLEGVTR